MRTACNREDVGEDTTTILVADDEDGCRKKSPVVLKPSSTECQLEKEASCGSGPIRSRNQIQYDGSGHIWSNDDGDADKSETCACFDGSFHDLCDCSPSCINRCIRRGSSNCGTLGTEVWNCQCFAYRPGKSLRQKTDQGDVPTLGN